VGHNSLNFGLFTQLQTNFGVPTTLIQKERSADHGMGLLRLPYEQKKKKNPAKV
jgi:hypothetical protein